MEKMIFYLTYEQYISMLNIGEKCEILSKRLLFNMKNEECIKVFGSEASEGIMVIDPDTNIIITDVSDIQNKSKSLNKADTIILFKKTQRRVAVSIKCFAGGSPSILNHTRRDTWVFQEGELSIYLPSLDNMITILNNKRTNGEVKQDIHLYNLKLKNVNIDISMINIIKYALFEGTGTKRSKVPANSILDIKNVNDISTWKYTDCSSEITKMFYALSIYKRCIVSLVSKGMKTHICEKQKPRIYNDNGKLKGSLHIRVEKSKM